MIPAYLKIGIIMSVSVIFAGIFTRMAPLDILQYLVYAPGIQPDLCGRYCAVCKDFKKQSQCDAGILSAHADHSGCGGSFSGYRTDNCPFLRVCTVPLL